MHFIIFDLEFNQDFSSSQDFGRKKSHYPFEIIQIGAVKLDATFHTIDTFNRYIKPSLYTKISPFITELTGITTDQLLMEQPFPDVYKDYIEFIGGTDSIFCIWGMSDIKELFKNATYHKLDNNLLPKLFINIQPYVSLHLNFPPKNLLRLQHAVMALHIPMPYAFHNAFYDAYYTAEIFKKIYNESMAPKCYDPLYMPIRPKQRKQEIDTEKLLLQFEKMYNRQMTKEEQEMIQLAYKMGKTHQFLK